jgi:putative FmdB family regulatory protein
VIPENAMPIYEYECTKCERRFEYMQSMSEAPKRKCEKCGGKLERLISQSAFHLKGGGWYKDLYAKKPGGSSSSEAASSPSSSEKKDAGTDSGSVASAGSGSGSEKKTTGTGSGSEKNSGSEKKKKAAKGGG